MLIPRNKKHSRRHIMEERIRHEGKLMRLALIHGMVDPWKTIWVRKASNKYSAREWCNWEEPDINIGLARLELQEEADD